MKCNNTTTCLMSEHLNRGRKWKLIMQYLQFLLSSIDKTECSLSGWFYCGRLSSWLVTCEVFFQDVHRYRMCVIIHRLNINRTVIKKINWMVHLNALDESLAPDIILSSKTNPLISIHAPIKNRSVFFSKQESRAYDLEWEREIAV